MLVVVKKPHTKRPLFEISGTIPAWIIEGVKKNYGKDADFEDDENRLVRAKDSDWYKEMEKSITAGESLRAYRTRDGLTQSALAERVGMTPQRINEMEKGRRGISKETAKKLARFFKTSPARFI